MCKVRLYHDDIWACASKLDCVLHGHCLQQIRKGYHACAPYPGAPNHQVPAITQLPVYINLFNWYGRIQMGRLIYEEDTGV